MEKMMNFLNVTLETSVVSEPSHIPNGRDQNPGGKGQCMVAFLRDLLFRKYAEILKKY